MLDDDETELRNPFPSPPSHYTNYTAHNLTLLSLLRERVPAEEPSATDATEPSTSTWLLPPIDVRQQYTTLADQNDVPDWPLTQLEPPRVDWILEEGQYTVFGDTWFVKESIPSLAELGGQQLYPADPTVDRRPALLAILRSMLVTYSALMKSLLLPPPPPGSVAPPDWHRHVEWVTVLSQNLMAAANDLRPVQARVNLEMMMQRQLELRKEETVMLHEKCDALEARLAELRISMVSSDSMPEGEQSWTRKAAPDAHNHMDGSSMNSDVGPVTVDNVLKWAEDIGI